MKYFKLLLIMILLNFFVAGTVVANEEINGTNQKLVYLYIELAGSGTLEKKANESGYTLALQDVRPWITYFTLTPERKAGLVHINDFNKILIKEAKKAPKGLNSGLVARDLSDVRNVQYTVSLKNPVYNAKDKSVSYDVDFLPGAQAEKKPNKIILNHVTLFIDPSPKYGGEGT